MRSARSRAFRRELACRLRRGRLVDREVEEHRVGLTGRYRGEVGLEQVAGRLGRQARPPDAADPEAAVGRAEHLERPRRELLALVAGGRVVVGPDPDEHPRFVPLVGLGPDRGISDDGPAAAVGEVAGDVRGIEPIRAVLGVEPHRLLGGEILLELRAAGVAGPDRRDLRPVRVGTEPGRAIARGPHPLDDPRRIVHRQRLAEGEPVGHQAVGGLDGLHERRLGRRPRRVDRRLFGTGDLVQLVAEGPGDRVGMSRGHREDRGEGRRVGVHQQGGQQAGVVAGVIDQALDGPLAMVGGSLRVAEDCGQRRGEVPPQRAERVEPGAGRSLLNQGFRHRGGVVRPSCVVRVVERRARRRRRGRRAN